MARIIGLDPGTKRCGVAITDREQRMAFPREALNVDLELIGKLRDLVVSEGVETIVVGLPYALNGGVTPSTEKAVNFFNEIAGAFPSLAVVQVDERLTTKQASSQLSQAGRKVEEQRTLIDSAAAVILLESYLEGIHRD
jgi:putative Holliday junction resolvase